MGNGIFSTEKITAFDKVKPARLLAIKVVFSRVDSVQNKVNTRKAKAKIVLSFMKDRAGDQKPNPATKITAITTLNNPLRVKQEFISSCGFLAWGRKRIRELFSPAMLIIASRLMADMMAEL